MMMSQCRFINFNKCTTMVEDGDNGGRFEWMRQEVYRKSLYLLFNFVMNIKLLDQKENSHILIEDISLKIDVLSKFKRKNCACTVREQNSYQILSSIISIWKSGLYKSVSQFFSKCIISNGYCSLMFMLF